jgi:hypothetical protein
VSDLPEEAVEAAAKTMLAHVESANTTLFDIAYGALAAAVPLLREQIAQEIEAGAYSSIAEDAVANAAEIARGTGQGQETPNQ